MTCRICLDDSGPFISPCACKGSLLHVHTLCLRQWLEAAPRYSPSPRCEVCHTFLHITDSHETAFILSSILMNPAFYVVIHGFFFILSRFIHNTDLESFLAFQYLFNLSYVIGLLMFVLVRVQNQGLYIQYCASFPHVIVIIGNVLIGGSLYNLRDKAAPFIYISILCQCFMSLYPITHNNILEEINMTHNRIYNLHHDDDNNDDDE